MRRRRAPLVVAVLAALPFLPTLRAQFIYDDSSIIRDNAMLRGWAAVLHVWSTPYWPVDGPDALGLYRPLQLSLLAMVWNAGGGRAIWFHLYALALSVSTALVVWWLLRRAVDAGPALVGAAWFAVHPLHVETIASVANSSELVVVLCTIGMVAVLTRWPASPARARDDWWRAAAFGIVAAGALAAKESGLLAVPIAAITAWGWQRRSETTRFVQDNVRAFVAALVSVNAVLLARFAVLGAPISHGSIAAQGIGALSGADRIVSMLSLWPKVAGMLVWPQQLAPYYGPTIFPANRAGVAVLMACVAAALLTLSVSLAGKGERRPLVALAWIALSYLPASNLLTPTGQILSDRVLFAATVGVAMLLATGIDSLNGFGRRVAAGVMICAVTWATVVSAHYAVAWTSHRTLWARLADVEPAEHLSYKLLGMDARARGDTARATALLERAFSMAPTDRQIRFEYGQALYGSQRFADAAGILAPLVRDEDARREPQFVTLYLDAVGRSGGPAAVIAAATPLTHSSSGAVASLFAGVALEELGERVAADSVYAAGLRRAPADTALASRLAALRLAHPQQPRPAVRASSRGGA